MITYKTIRGKYPLDHEQVSYFFSKDDSTFCHLNDSIVQVDTRLYVIEEQLFDKGFVRISKWCIVNVNMIKSAFRLFNSRIKLKLISGHDLYVNRAYIKSFNQYLKGKGDING